MPAAQNARTNSNADFDSMTPGQVRQWALDAYAAGQISEETLDQIQESIDAQEDMEGREISPEAELKRIGMGDSAQHSISPTFAAEIDAWDGKKKRVFRVGTVSEALRSIGIKDSGIIWHSGKINKIMQVHSAMTKDIIKQVPEILEHPVAVLASKQSDSRLVIFGTVTDANGDPVTAILELQPTTKGGQLLDMTVIASAYGKEGNVAKFVEGSGLVYLDPDRKRTESWMQSVGLQLPSDATAFGSIGSVSYPDGKVKIESIPYDQYTQEPEEDAADGRQYSISEPTVDKADVISNLRAILDKGGDPAALRRYVARLEQNTGKTEHNNGFAERDNGFAYQKAETAQEILAAAKAQEISVEEYLEQNWERYDTDGQWNAQAQEALDQEERASRRQYSISESGKLDDFDAVQRNALLRKRPIQLSQKAWAKVNQARVQRYASIDEDDIPEIDIFYIAEYNELIRALLIRFGIIPKNPLLRYRGNKSSRRSKRSWTGRNKLMEEARKANQLARTMFQMGAQKDLVLGVLTMLETEEKCKKMLQELEQKQNPSRTWIIGTALLIAEPEETEG